MLRNTKTPKLPSLPFSLATGKLGSFGRKGAAMTVFCPVCQVAAAQVLSKYTVTVRRDSESDVGALLVYQCPAAHIFFVRGTDITESRPTDYVFQVVPRA